jgi:hypothetical protein
MKPLYGCLVLASLVLAPAAGAASDMEAPAPNERMLVRDNFGGFLESQPDLLHYRMGLEAYRDGDAAAAMRHFLIAARYADKPSQALVAQMYWDGIGVSRDRALAYAWMDLAAERGNGRLLAMREHYWESLDEAQRADALERGQRVYAQYGDDVAQRRIEFVLRRKKNQIAGSRTGYTGNATVLALVPGAGPNHASAEGISPAEVPPLSAMAAASFYHPTYWQPERRYAWRDQQWEREFRVGTNGNARVGELKQLRPDAPAD